MTPTPDTQTALGAVQRSLGDTGVHCLAEQISRETRFLCEPVLEKRHRLGNFALTCFRLYPQAFCLSDSGERAVSHCRCRQPRFLAPGPSPVSEIVR